MSRINATINPVSLCNEHLLAEYKEILRVTNLSTNKPLNLSKLPKEFTLGTGHVKLFYDKLLFIHKRFNSLKEELIKRNYECNIDFNTDKIANHKFLYNDWSGTLKANLLIIDRITHTFLFFSVNYQF